jgi:tetratricopeptide (TPR) repeat protein
MDIWYVGLVLGVVVMIVGLVFLAKRWGTQGRATLGYKLFKVAGSPAFVVFAVGAGGAAYSIDQLADEEAQRRDPSVVLGSIEEVRNVSPFRFPAQGSKAERTEAFGRWLLAFFEEGQVVVDKGRNDGIREGQLLTTLEDRVTPRTVRRSELGSYNSDGTATLKVVAARSDESVAQLTEFAIDPYVRRLPSDPKASIPGPVEAEQRVLALPEDETEAMSDVQRELSAASEQKRNREVRRLHFAQALEEAEDFLDRYPDSFLAPDVLFDMGDAERGLGRRKDALDTFGDFVERYPFHSSVDGARERIEALGGSPPALE